jgi:hypothetical protein
MRQDATRAVSPSVLICVALTSGAILGMAAQTALHHFGLDLGSVRNDLIVDRVAQSRSALAWWAWWFVAVAAFFIGPFSVALTRYLAANRCLFRGLRLLVSAALVLGLSAVGHLSPAPSALGGIAGVGVGVLVVFFSALLAALGARSIRVGERRDAGTSALVKGRSRALTLAPGLRPARGGGSVNLGSPMRRHGGSLVPRPGRIVRAARVAMAAAGVVAAVSLVSAATVVLELATAGGIRELVARYVAPADANSRLARTIAWALRPADQTAGPDPRAAVAAAPLEPARPAPPLARPPAVRTAALEIAVIPIPESELTFAKGYAKRRAALKAAAAVVPPTPEIKLPSKLASRVVAFHIERSGRLHRHSASDRHGGHKRYAAYDRHPGYGRHGGHKRHRDERYGSHDRYARYDRR